jgi:hypothetical protein
MRMASAGLAAGHEWLRGSARGGGLIALRPVRFAIACGDLR